MANDSPRNDQTGGGWHLNGNGTYLGRVGTRLKTAMSAVSSIRRQAESALEKRGKH
ncbi:MAG: hypothetical protein ACM3X6_13825 [Patescibacteria group bacterium]